MRIAHLVSTFPPYHGGIGNACFNQAKFLSELGHEITVFTPRYNREFNAYGLPFKVVGLKPVLKYGNAAFVPSIIKNLNDFDIVHLHYPFIGGMELLKKIEQPLVLQYHMDLFLSFPLSLIPIIYKSTITKGLLNKAKKIIISSGDYIEGSKIVGGFFKKNKDKFVEIPYGVDLNRFKPAEKNRELMNKFNLSAVDKIILFVGGLDKPHYFKGMDLLLQAMTNDKLLMTNIKLIIVGAGNLKTQYEKMAKELGIKNKTIFTGEVGDDKLPDYYNLADVFVLPSINRSESFGIVLIEAMACGRACIASNLPGLRIVIDDHKTGFLFKTRDSDDLSEKIKNLLKNDGLRKKMSEQARKRAEEKYDWRKIVKKIENVYQNITKN